MDDLSDGQIGKREQLYVCAHVHACINSMDPIQDGAPKIWKKQGQKGSLKKSTKYAMFSPLWCITQSTKKKLI